MLKTEFGISELKERSIRGGLFTVGSQGVKLLITLASTVILARLLTPRDFGLIAMVTAVTGIAHIFKTMGLSAASVQAKEISQEQVSTLFWINLALGLGTALLFCALAPAIAAFYGEPRLLLISLTLSSTFVFSGLGLQHRALLQRQMRFAVLGSIDLASQAVGILVAILAAWYGSSYWALVLNIVAVFASGTLFMWIASGWRPGLPVRGAGIHRFFRFGANFTGFHLLTYLLRNLDNMLIGATWGAGALGLYSKAYGLLLLPISQINDPLTSVALTSLSRLQDDPERFRHYYCRAISLAAAVAMPMLAFAYLSADELVLLVFGKGWSGVTPLFRALTPAAFAASLNVVIDWVLVPLGRTDRQFRCLLWSAPLVIGSFFIGLPYGPMGVAVGCSVSMLLLRIPQVLYALHGTPVSVRDLVGAIWRSAFSSCGCLTLLWILMRAFPVTLSVPEKLAVMCALYGLLYLLIFLVLPGGKAFLNESAAMILERRSRS